MHVLIIPSEQFVPHDDPSAGIFQFHQGEILANKGNKVGAVSIKLRFTIPMIFKAALLRLVGKKAQNDCDGYSMGGLFKLLQDKLNRPEKFIEKETRCVINVVRITGFYYWSTSVDSELQGWLKAGEVAVDEYIKEHGEPDIIHAHNAISAGVLADKLCKKYNVPYVITEHSTYFARGLYDAPNLLNAVKQAYANSNGAYAVSQSFADLLSKKLEGVNIGVLHNVLDPYLEQRAIEVGQKAPNGDFVFVNIAELHPKKNHKLLLDSFKKVKEIRPQVKLKLGGAGELEEELKDYVKDNGIEGIEFLGFLNRDGVLKAISNSDCFVLSSKYETFGVVVIESMLFGKPCVVTKCGGPETIVDKETGIVVEEHSVAEYAKAMLHVVDNYDDYNNEKIKAICIEKYGAESFANKLETIYRTAIEN